METGTGQNTKKNLNKFLNSKRPIKLFLTALIAIIPSSIHWTTFKYI
jgi:hypothetical protein